MTLTQTRLKELLNYDPETGIFTWLKSLRGHVRNGDKAGRMKPNGYLSIKIDQVDYYAHRLAFLYMKGGWPAVEIDHKSRVRSDNRWSNLRPADKHQNQGNSPGRPSRNTSGLKGVSLHRQSGLYRARISTRTIGYFSTKQAAHDAYMAAAREKFGEFASS